MTPYICEKFDLRIRRKEFTGPEILRTLGHFLSVLVPLAVLNLPVLPTGSSYTRELCPGSGAAHASGCSSGCGSWWCWASCLSLPFPLDFSKGRWTYSSLRGRVNRMNPFQSLNRHTICFTSLVFPYPNHPLLPLWVSLPFANML